LRQALSSLRVKKFKAKQINRSQSSDCPLDVAHLALNEQFAYNFAVGSKIFSRATGFITCM
jgi:hypothetical protein